LAPIVVAATVVLAQQGSAQGQLPYSLFERYLDALRQQTGIPGLSAAIVKDRRVEWERGFGVQDVERSVPAAPDTPFLIGGLAQSMAAVLLGECAEGGRLNIGEPIRRWAPDFPLASATVHHVLAHATEGAAGRFQYDPARYARLTPVVEDCARESYAALASEHILERLGMSDSVPGLDLARPDSAARGQFDQGRLDRYENVLARLAVPYRVDRASNRPSRSEVASRGVDAADGMISTVRDLARFDSALDDGALLRPGTLAVAWTPANFGSGDLPTGLGWFVYPYGGERIVWHFGLVPDAYSSLVLKMPARRLTLILLANSDGLSTGANLEVGDVTASPFVKIFLRLFA
jgi:CubicO group peptidase (beta-lactamase class C family)